MSARASNNIPPSLRKVWQEQEDRMVASNHDAFTGRAIVCHDSLKNNGWKMEDNISTGQLGDNELVVEMVASGVCHTDILVGSEPDFPMQSFPRILGHEGSGYVRAIGKAVKVAEIGDPVLLSFTYCGKCACCESSHLSVCEQFVALNFGCERKPFSAKSINGGNEIPGRFFGQSSFAEYSVVSDRSCVNVKHIVKDKKELALFAPLGCGIQTGSGTVINRAKATPKDVVAIIGQGGVGLSAVMGAKISGSRIIIGIDRVQKRLDLAKELGATHVVNTADLPEGKTVVDAVREIADGVGPTITIDTSGFPALIKSGVEWTRPHGRIIQVGSAPPDFKLEINVFEFMCLGKEFIGAIEGDSIPSEYVPKMIQWYRDGKFPIDRLIKFIPAEKFEDAIHEMHTGVTVKPVLLWS